uniref:Uncharacterized protein n=1 Tax=Glossina austeni TaxID=7395 RepID=A0A1A9UZ84_GLOAU
MKCEKFHIVVGSIKVLKFSTHIGRTLSSDDLLIDALGETVKVQDVSDIFEFWGVLIEYPAKGRVLLKNTLLQLRTFLQSTWQSTPLSIQILDFCMDMVDTNSDVYGVSQKIFNALNRVHIKLLLPHLI